MNLSAIAQFECSVLDLSTIYTCSEKQGSKVAPICMQVSMVIGVTLGGGEYRAQLYRPDIVPAHLPTLIFVLLFSVKVTALLVWSQF